MFRRSFVDLVLVPPNEDLRLYVDFYLSTFAGLLTGVIAIHEALYAYRMHGGNKHSNATVLGGRYNSSTQPWETVRANTLRLIRGVLEGKAEAFRAAFGEGRHDEAMALVAGQPDAIEAAAKVLGIIAPQRVHAGAIGDASRTKLAINLILQNNRAALAEGIVFAESLGLDPQMFLATARRSAAYSKVMDTKGSKMLMRDFAPQSHISQTLKDAELILGEAKRRNLRLPVTSAQANLLRAAIALCGPECDSSAIIEAIRPSHLQPEKPE